MPKRIDSLTDQQRAMMSAHADKWIEIGLRTGPADRATFEHAARECYQHANIPWPGRVVWVPSPIVIALAAPIAALIIHLRRGAVGAVRGEVDGAMHDAVDAVRDEVRVAVRDEVDAVRVAVDGEVRDEVHDEVRVAVGGAVHDAVDAVRVAVDGAVHGEVRDAVGNAIDQLWYQYMGGQFWVGGYYWGGAFTSFFREVCDLELPGDLWARGIAYEQTMQSACWWYPHRNFVMACERPVVIHREKVNLARPRGVGSHRLHCDTGPAVAWPDGWGVYAVHGVRVPRWIVERPQDISIARIDAEQNAEVRRVMIQRYGTARYIQDSGAEVVHSLPDNYYVRGLQGAKLYRKPRHDDTDIVIIAAKNSTPEPDGSVKSYFLRIQPNAYDGLASRDCHAAMASTWRNHDGSLYYRRPQDYAPSIET